MKYIKSSSTLVEKEFLTDTVIELKFRLHQSIDWVPGEFINLNVGGDNWRSYSVLSYEDDIATFIVDIRPDGVGSKFLKSVDVGTEVNFIGPFGKFLLEEGAYHLFVCTGTGLAPIIPMIKKLLKSGSQEISLLYGVRYDKDDLLGRYFSNKELKQMEVVRCITRSVRTNDVFNGRVTAYLNENRIEGKGVVAYICGNPKMVVEANNILSEMSIDKIITEKY